MSAASRPPSGPAGFSGFSSSPAAQAAPRRIRVAGPSARIDSAEWPSTVWNTRALPYWYAHASGSSLPVSFDFAVTSASTGSVPCWR